MVPPPPWTYTITASLLAGVAAAGAITFRRRQSSELGSIGGFDRVLQVRQNGLGDPTLFGQESGQLSARNHPFSNGWWGGWKHSNNLVTTHEQHTQDDRGVAEPEISA